MAVGKSRWISAWHSAHVAEPTKVAPAIWGGAMTVRDTVAQEIRTTATTTSRPEQTHLATFSVRPRRTPRKVETQNRKPVLPLCNTADFSFRPLNMAHPFDQRCTTDSYFQLNAQATKRDPPSIHLDFPTPVFPPKSLLPLCRSLVGNSSPHFVAFVGSAL